MAMAFFAAGEDFAGGDVERGKQRCRAVADIVVRHTFDITQAHRENGLGAVQRLDLALLIHAQDHGVLGRIKIQTDNIADFFDEKGIIGDFKMALPMGLKAKGAPDPLDGGPRDLRFLGDRARRPVGPVCRLGLKGLSDKLRDSFIGDRAGATRTEFIVKASYSLLLITSTPTADGVGTVTDFPGDLLIRDTISRHHYDSGTRDQAKGKGTGTGERLKRLPFLIGQNDVHLFRPACSHGHLH